MYYIYMIRCHDNSIYTGITKDIYKRIKEHYYKTKACAKYTRTRDVVSLEAVWITENRSLASKLEYHLKHLTKSQKEKIILNPDLLGQTEYQYQKAITLEMCLEK